MTETADCELLLLGVMLAIALQALFYPPIAFIDVGILLLQLWDWQNGRLRFSQNRQDYLLCATSVGVFLVAIVPYAIKFSQFGPTITGVSGVRSQESGGSDLALLSETRFLENDSSSKP